jgi:hypothetical protein
MYVCNYRKHLYALSQLDHRPVLLDTPDLVGHTGGDDTCRYVSVAGHHPTDSRMDNGMLETGLRHPH